MSNLNDQISAIHLKHSMAATAEVMALCQSVAASAFNIGGALPTAMPAATATSAPARARKPAAKKVASEVKAKKVKKSASSQKRTPEQFDTIKAEILTYLRANPSGVGVEAVSKALKRDSKELTLPIKKLLAEKLIQAQGQKRATKYFPKA